ncbi:hypothetical protein C5L14_01190 [Labrys okinawensis]|uniref:Glycosyl transferase family 1 domain-containing protein n=1 Tax=Labrys okinawensis TaxID=346911 RepID=A0A2S9QIP7_9HYPH|nr:glycosyltransferase family 4 protein [Labrys okinawensis]PRH89239.1 hypothetical protein C5L14_01190 [Labrys okinawensis]
MKSVLSYPGTMPHAQQIALALHEQGCLKTFVTGFHYSAQGWGDRLLRALPSSQAAALREQLLRRSIETVPHSLVQAYPAWEILRSIAARGGAGPLIVDRLWDLTSHRFDAAVASRHVPGADAIHAFEYTALASFQRAAQEGAARILHLPSLSSRHFESIRRRELARWKQLDDANAAYFSDRFARRQARRDAEIGLADLIVTNSALTARSHIAGGADPAKMLVVPLGAPPVLDRAQPPDGKATGPLRVVYAGNVTLGKGVPYLLEAWRRLPAAAHARLDIYGWIGLPADLLAPADDAIRFHGARPRAELFRAFEQADILVFPSLADGFGMVVAEAMAHGLPVIVTDMAGAADLVTPENGLVIPSADTEALTQTLAWCLDNRERLQAMRTAALEAARLHQWPAYRAALAGGLGQRLGSPGQGASAPQMERT